MKLKFRFLGRLLPFRKQDQQDKGASRMFQDTELYFAIGLVLLWLLVFIFSYLKPFTNHK